MLEENPYIRAAFDRKHRARPFVKMQGLLNHFVIVDGRTDRFSPSRDEVMGICDPKTGVGADELIIVEQIRGPCTQEEADAFMRIINVDGTEVEACGNATRCVAMLLMDEAGSSTVRIETLAGVLQCHRAAENLVGVNMGRATMDWREIPLASPCDTSCLDIGLGTLKGPAAVAIGNPHMVFWVDDLDAYDLEEFGPTLQRHPLFPHQANVGLAQITSPGSMRLTVFERPGILTTACGSGACAAVFAAHKTNRLKSSPVTVSMPAGDLRIEVMPNDEVIMTGPAEHCFDGYL